MISDLLLSLSFPNEEHWDMVAIGVDHASCAIGQAHIRVQHDGLDLIRDLVVAMRHANGHHLMGHNDRGRQVCG